MRSLSDPGFGDDAGSAPAALAAALEQYAVDQAGNPVLAVLSAAEPAVRLLVPVLAAPGGSEAPAQREGDVSTVLLEGADGRLAMLAFTSVAALAAWRPQARPVPVTARRAAQATLSEGAAALVVDVAGPVPFVVETADLVEIAKGHRLLSTDAGYGWFADWLPATR